jgi:hypothetical protein
MTAARVNDRTESIWAFVSYALAVGLVFRAITCITRNRMRETPFEQVADISPPFLITAAVLIITGHLLERWTPRAQALALFGHVLGWMFTWNFMITLYIGVVRGTTGGVSGEVWFLVGLAHVIRAWFCGRRAARWIQRRSS